MGNTHLLQPKKLPWVSNNYPNVAYSFHPYQQISCCGQIGSDPTNELSITDPFEVAYCNYPYVENNNPIASDSVLPVPGLCDFTGYVEAVDKKSPPCIWSNIAYVPDNSDNPGLCVGDYDTCYALDQSDCMTVQLDWSSPTAGGWSKWVLPMQSYGPLIATEFGSFDCSSPYVAQFLKWARQFGVSYTAWAIWPGDTPIVEQACSYPSIIYPSVSPGIGFGQGPVNCTTLSGCLKVLTPLPYAGVTIVSDIMQGS